MSGNVWESFTTGTNGHEVAKSAGREEEMGREVLRQDGIDLEAPALRGVPEAGAPVWVSEAVVQVQEHESEEGG